MTAVVPLEREVKSRVIAIFRAFGGRVFNLDQGFRPGGPRHGTTRQTKGLPDLYVMFPARRQAAWFEVKRPGGTRSPEQETFADLCEACGLPYNWGGAEEAYALLRRLGFELLDNRGLSTVAEVAR